ALLTACALGCLEDHPAAVAEQRPRPLEPLLRAEARVACRLRRSVRIPAPSGSLRGGEEPWSGPRPRACHAWTGHDRRLGHGRRPRGERLPREGRDGCRRWLDKIAFVEAKPEDVRRLVARIAKNASEVRTKLEDLVKRYPAIHLEPPPPAEIEQRARESQYKEQ